MAKSEWGFETNSWKDSLPLGRAAEQFLMENCQYMLYHRRDERFPCPDCFDPIAASSEFGGNPNCTKCYGFGVKVDFMVVPARGDYGTGTIGPMEGDVRTQPGYNYRGYISISFPRRVYPKLVDLVSVCEWDKPTQLMGKNPKGRVLKIADTYIIRDLNSHFERELGWVQCGVEVYQLQDTKLENLLHRLVNIPLFPESKLWSEKTYW